MPSLRCDLGSLDQRDDGSDIQQYLAEKYGQKTVPQVFVNKVSFICLAPLGFSFPTSIG